MSGNLLTMVFTDLVASTAVKARLPGADVTERNRAYLESILTPHRRRMEADLAAHDGHVVKTDGDGYFLIFQDADQAARWAVDVQRSHVADPIDTPHGPLQVRIGMHTGSPLPDPEEPLDYVGHEVDYASRVSALANGGQVLMSEVSAALVRAEHVEGVEVHSHGEIILKGIGRVPIFELLYDGNPPQPLKDALHSLTNLPLPPEGFTGRADLLAELRERLRAGGVTILKGEGGIGKTALALTASHDAHVEGEFPGGIAWINCEPQPSRDDCLRLMAQVFFGDRMNKEPMESCQALVEGHLHEGGSLVVFDNFESVAKDTALRRWVSATRTPARVLVTTREVPPGLHGRLIPVHELRRPDAVRLFVERAAAVGLDVVENDALINDLCAAVGDQPLAIELLAARAASVPLGRLLERVNRDLGVLDAKHDPTRPGRHQSARICLALSYEHLSDAARDLAIHLAVLPDSAGVELISTISTAADWDEAAEELVANSVWRLTGSRYAAHPLVRQFVLEQLGDHRRGEVERQIAHAMSQLVQLKGTQTNPALAAPNALFAALDWFESEWRNLLACMDFATAAGDWDTVYTLSAAILHFWDMRGYWTDAERIYTTALDATRRSGNRLGEGRTLHHLGLVYRHQGRWAEAEAAYRRSLALAREIGDRPGEGQVLKNLARILQLQERYTDSETTAELGLQIVREVGDRVGEAKTLAYLANVYRFQGRWEEAEASYQRSLLLAREAGHRYDEAAVLRYLGIVYQHHRRFDEAEAAYRESLAIRREFGDRLGEAIIIIHLGMALEDQERWDEAESAFQRSLEISRELRDRDHEGIAIYHLARLRSTRGEPAQALELARQALAILSTTEDAHALSESRDLVAELAVAAGQAEGFKTPQ